MNSISRSACLSSIILIASIPSLIAANNSEAVADIADRAVYRKFDMTVHRGRSNALPALYSDTALVQGVSTGSGTAPYTLIIVDPYPVIDIPFVTRFYRDVVPQLEKRYVSNGQMRVVSLPYFSVGDYGLALWCAEDQKMGWAYNQAAFAGFSHAFPALDDSSDHRVDDELATIAEVSGLVVSTFRACVNERRKAFPRWEDNSNRIRGYLNPIWGPEKPLTQGSIFLARSNEAETRLQGYTIDLTHITAEELIDWMDSTMTEGAAHSESIN